MKLVEAVKLGKFCELETIEECVANVKIHSLSLFLHSRINAELKELDKEYNSYKRKNT